MLADIIEFIVVENLITAALSAFGIIIAVLITPPAAAARFLIKTAKRLQKRQH